MRLKPLFYLFLLLLLSGCGTSSQVYVGAEAGPLEIVLSVDDKGQVEISGGIAPKLEMGLGPVSLKAGVQQTVALTKETPYTLFVLRQESTGDVTRTEYEIGKPFRVVFSQEEKVQEIQGYNDSVIVVVQISEHQTSDTASTNTPMIVTVVVTAKPHSPTATIKPTKTEANTSSANGPKSPEQFIRDYFRLLFARKYEITYAMLSSDFQSNHTFASYTSFWDSVERVNILLIDVRSETSSYAYVYVEANYYYKNGATTTAHTTYKLIRNGDSWLFDPN